MAGRIYRSVVDEINTRRFKCLVSISYFRRIHPVEAKKEEITHYTGGLYTQRTKTIVHRPTPLPSSLYVAYNEDQRETSRVSIPDMVDMFVKKVYCEILSDMDVIHILHLIDGYLEVIRHKLEIRDPAYIEFVRPLTLFRNQFIYPCFRRNLHKYPRLLDQYRTYNTGMNNVWLKLFGVSVENFKDGIDRLKYPPYDVWQYIDPAPAESIKTEKDTKSTEMKPKRSEDDFYDDIFKDFGAGR